MFPIPKFNISYPKKNYLSFPNPNQNEKAKNRRKINNIIKILLFHGLLKQNLIKKIVLFY